MQIRGQKRSVSGCETGVQVGEGFKRLCASLTDFVSSGVFRQPFVDELQDLLDLHHMEGSRYRTPTQACKFVVRGKITIHVRNLT